MKYFGLGFYNKATVVSNGVFYSRTGSIVVVLAPHSWGCRFESKQCPSDCVRMNKTQSLGSN